MNNEKKTARTIVMIAPTPFFSDRGCHTRILNEILPLQRLGYKITLVTYGLGRDIKGVNTVRCANLPWYKKLSAGPSIWKFILDPLLFVKALHVIKKDKPQIVHAFLHEGALIAKGCKLFCKDSTYFFDLQGSLTGELLQHKFISPKGVIYKLFYSIEKMINKSFPIITQSENLTAQLYKMGIAEDKVVNALDCVDVDLFSPRVPDKGLAKSLGIDLSAPRVIYVGVLEEYQGTDVMLEAFAKVSETIPGVQYIIIGYPNIDKYKELAAGLGIGESCKFVGKVEYDILPEYLALSTIAVAPKLSMVEGDGKIYNYMAMGLATVAFDKSISHEIMDDCGLYAIYNDATDLSKKIINLINNQHFVDSIGKKARQRACSFLSSDISAKKISAFYDKFI